MSKFTMTNLQKIMVGKSMWHFIVFDVINYALFESFYGLVIATFLYPGSV